MEGAGEGCLGKAIAARSLWEAARAGALQHPRGCHRGNQPRASPTTGKEGEREVWGEGTRIITRAGLIAINIKNQINMSRCVFHFSHICGT